MTAGDSRRSRQHQADEDADAGLSFFSDSLSSLFDVHTPSRGTPGSRLVYSHPLLPPNPLASSSSVGSLTYNIPDHDGVNTKLFAHYQWDAGWELANEIVLSSSRSSASSSSPSSSTSSRWADVRGKTTLELGAGTGLPSLVAARMGARRCIVTDYPDEGILRCLRGNVELEEKERRSRRGDQESIQEDEQKLLVRGLAWGDEAQERELLSLQPGGYDRLLIADTLWVSSSHPLLIHSLLQLISRAHGRVLVAAGYHSGIPCVRRFFEACERGMSGMGRLVPDEEMGGIRERNVQSGETGKCAWYKSANDGQEDQNDDMGSIEERAKRCVLACLRWAPYVEQEQAK